MREELNELQTNKRKHYLQSNEKINLVWKRKIAKLKGLKSSKDITPDFEMPVSESNGQIPKSLERKSTEKSDKENDVE